MSNAQIEVAHSITFQSVERVHRLVCDWQAEGRRGVLDQAMRAARARDPKLMRALDLAAEVMDQAVEDQIGRTRRDHSKRDPGKFTDRGYPPEAGVWKAAYEALDKGAPVEALGWVYVAAGVLAGVVL